VRVMAETMEILMAMMIIKNDDELKEPVFVSPTSSTPWIPGSLWPQVSLYLSHLPAQLGQILATHGLLSCASHQWPEQRQEQRTTAGNKLACIAEVAFQSAQDMARSCGMNHLFQ